MSCVNFSVLGNPAELSRKLEFHADIAIFVNLDMVYKFNQNFPAKCYNVLVFHKGHKSGMRVDDIVSCLEKELAIIEGTAARLGDYPVRGVLRAARKMDFRGKPPLQSRRPCDMIGKIPHRT